MIDPIFKKHFREIIRGISFNPENKYFYIGLSQRSGLNYHDSEIWSFNSDFSQNKLLFKDNYGIKFFNGFIYKNQFVIIALLTYPNGGFAKAIKLNMDGTINELFVSNDRHRNEFDSVSLAKLSYDHDPCFIIHGFKALVICDNEIKDLTEYLKIQLPKDFSKKILKGVVTLHEFKDSNRMIPEIAVIRGINQIEGFEKGNNIFSYDYRGIMNKINLGSTREVVIKAHQNDLFLFLINKGQQPSNSLIVKNFNRHCVLKGSYWPTVIKDLDGDGEDELICAGDWHWLLGFHSVKIYKNIFESEPKLTFKKRMPDLIALLAEDINNDGLFEIITATEHTITVNKFR